MLKPLPKTGILTLKRRWRLSNAQPRRVFGSVPTLPCTGVIQKMIVWCVTIVYPILCFQIPWSLVLCPKEEINIARIIVLSTGGHNAIQWNWSLRPMNICLCYSNGMVYHHKLLSITLRINPWVSLPVYFVKLVVTLQTQSPITHGWWLLKDVSNT